MLCGCSSTPTGTTGDGAKSSGPVSGDEFIFLAQAVQDDATSRITSCLAKGEFPGLGRLLEEAPKDKTLSMIVEIGPGELGPATTSDANKFGMVGMPQKGRTEPPPIPDLNNDRYSKALEACQSDPKTLAKLRASGRATDVLTKYRSESLVEIQDNVESVMVKQYTCLRSRYPKSAKLKSGISNSKLLEVLGIPRGREVSEKVTVIKVDSVNVEIESRSSDYIPSAPEVKLAKAWALCNQRSQLNNKVAGYFDKAMELELASNAHEVSTVHKSLKAVE